MERLGALLLCAACLCLCSVMAADDVSSSGESSSCGLPDGNCNNEMNSSAENPLCDSPDGNCNKEVKSTTEHPSCGSPDGNCDQKMESTTEHPSCGSPDGNCDKVNVAEGKVASMSVPYEQPGYSSGPADLAVDGNTSTDYRSCVHTLGTTDNDPDWWQVDLGRPYTVTNITIYHREGGSVSRPFAQRIAGVWVYVDETLCYKFADSYNIGRERKLRDDITCRRPIRGQIVRFAKNGMIHTQHYSFINFCEVQIWACKRGLYGQQCENQCDCPQGVCDNYDGACHVPMERSTKSPSCDSPDGNCNIVNVAEGKVASMSVPYEQPGYSSGPADLAVDGNTSTDYRSCVHTLGTTDNDPDWWQVDPGRPYTVTNITIYHREGGRQPHPFSQRIAGVWIYVDDTLCYKFPNSLNVGRTPKERDDITCQSPIRGQVVRFAKDGFTHARHYSFINFCEVQIWVCKSGMFGPQCDKTCDSHCQQGLCDNYNGNCEIGCNAGYYGSDCSEQCGQCRVQETCDRHTGRCPHGCQPDYRPPDCQYAITTTQELKPTTPTTTTTTLSTHDRSELASTLTSLTTTSTVGISSHMVTDSNQSVVVLTNNSHHSGPMPAVGRSGASRQHPVSDDGNDGSSSSSSSSDKKYTHADMAGLAVAMTVLGALFGVACFVLYHRYFRGKRTDTGDIPFRLMHSAADTY